MDASDARNSRKYPVTSSQTPPTFAVPCDRSAVPYLSLECKESPSPSSPHWRIGAAFESPFRRYGGIGSLAHPISVGRTRADGSLKQQDSVVVSDSASHKLAKAEAGTNTFCYNSPPQSSIIMSPSSALLPKDTPNVKFRMELASQIQESPSSLAHLDANLMLNIGDTPNDKIRYAYRFGDDFGGASPGTESASSVQRFIRGMPRAFAFANTDSHRSESGSPTSDADALYTVPDHNIGINTENPELVATFGQSRLASGTPVNEAGVLKSKLRFCSCRRSLCLKLYCECFSTGRLCSGQCKCNNCHNDVAHAEERMAAARHILQRNPTAFSPKIQEDGNDARLAPTPTGEAQLSHVRGCHCKKSGCLKRYCECFQAGVICGPHCKCTNCLNTNAAIFYNTDPSNSNAVTARATTPSSAVPGETSPIDHRVTPRAPGPVRLIPLFDSSPNSGFERRSCGLDALTYTSEQNHYFASHVMPFTAIPNYLDHTMSPSSTASRRRTRLDFESNSRDGFC